MSYLECVGGACTEPWATRQQVFHSREGEYSTVPILAIDDTTLMTQSSMLDTNLELRSLHMAVEASPCVWCTCSRPLSMSYFCCPWGGTTFSTRRTGSNRVSCRMPASFVMVIYRLCSVDNSSCS